VKFSLNLANISRSYDGCSRGPLFIRTQCTITFYKQWSLVMLYATSRLTANLPAVTVPTTLPPHYCHRQNLYFFSIISENHVYFKLKQSSSCHPAHLVISFVISGIAICSAIVVLLSQYKQRSQRYGDKEQLSTFF